MENRKQIIILFLIFFCNFLNAFSQSTENVGIGTLTPDNSALLHLDVSNATTKRGLLIPSMTAAQRNSISNPAKGLMVFVTDDNNFYYNSGTPATPIWTVILSGIANVSFQNISSGTNTNSILIVGSGSALSTSGTGSIQANKFVGSSSLSDNVDLATNEVNGILPISNGGTGIFSTPTNGQILIGNGTNYTLANITGGTGITVTNGSGSIQLSTNTSTIDHNSLLNLQIAGTGVTYGHLNDQAQTIAGMKTFESNITAPNYISTIATGTAPFTVTSSTLVTNLNSDMLDGKHSTDFLSSTGLGNLTASSNGITITGGTGAVFGTGTTIKIDTASGTKIGFLSSTDWITFNNKIGNSSVAGGDLSGTYPNPTVAKIRGINIATTIPTNGQVLKYNNSTSQWEPSTTTGTVTSVGLVLPSEFVVSGSPVTDSGTLTGVWTNQTQKKVFASPVTGSGVPSFRLIDSSDIPGISSDKIITGTLPLQRGGTGASTLTGMLKGNGTTAVSGITAKSKQITFWSDDNTIGGHDSLSWDSSSQTFSIGGDLKVTGIIDPKALIFIPQSTQPSTKLGALYYDGSNNKLQIITNNGAETILTGTIISSNWSLNGNSGTNPNVNFIGTSDNKDILLKTNNLERARISNNGKLLVNTSTLPDDSIQVSISGDLEIAGDIISTGNIKQEVMALNPRTTNPINAVEGMAYYDNTENVIKVYDGTNWNKMNNNPITLRVFLKDNFSIPSQSWTKINFDSTNFDSHSAFSSGKFTAPLTGYFQVSSLVTTLLDSNNASVFEEISIYINGSKYSEGGIGFAYNQDPDYISKSNINDLIYLNKDDYLEIYIKCKSSVKVAVGGISTCYLSINQVK